MPKPILFIQHSLVWIENAKPNKVKKNLKYISLSQISKELGVKV